MHEKQKKTCKFPVESGLSGSNKETRRTDSASPAIPTLFLVLPYKPDIKRH